MILLCYLLKEKPKALNPFEVFWAELTNQLDRKIKVMKSDRGGEYYGRHANRGQSEGPFACFLKSKGIVAQYSTLGTPQLSTPKSYTRHWTRMPRLIIHTSVKS